MGTVGFERSKTSGQGCGIGGGFSIGDGLFVTQDWHAERSADEQFVIVIATEGEADLVHGSGGFHHRVMV